MSGISKYLIELTAVGGFILFLSFVKLSIISLGAILTAAGAFFPSNGVDSKGESGSIKILGASINLKGSLRLGLIIAGLLLITSAGVSAYRDSNSFAEAKEIAAEQMEYIEKEENIDLKLEKLKTLRSSLRRMNYLKNDDNLVLFIDRLDRIIERYEQATSKKGNAL